MYFVYSGRIIDNNGPKAVLYSVCVSVKKCCVFSKNTSDPVKQPHYKNKTGLVLTVQVAVKGARHKYKIKNIRYGIFNYSLFGIGISIKIK